KDQYLVDLITFSTINIDLSIYKPSLIVETCRYILYNKFDIYHQNEINVICKLIKNFVNQSVKSSLKNIKNKANILQPLLKYECKEDIEQIILSPIKYNEEWHLGDITILDLLGEGSYGSVKKIKRHLCGKEYAIKIAKNDESHII